MTPRPKTSKYAIKQNKKPASITSMHASTLGKLGGRPRKDKTQENRDFGRTGSKAEASREFPR